MSNVPAGRHSATAEVVGWLARGLDWAPRDTPKLGTAGRDWDAAGKLRNSNECLGWAQPG